MAIRKISGGGGGGGVVGGVVGGEGGGVGGGGGGGEGGEGGGGGGGEGGGVDGDGEHKFNRYSIKGMFPMTQVDFCEQHDYATTKIDHIRRKLKLGIVKLINGHKIIMLDDTECAEIEKYIIEQEELKKKKVSTKYGHHGYECPGCGCHLKFKVEHCPNKKCPAHDKPLDWQLLFDHMPKKAKRTWDGNEEVV